VDSIINVWDLEKGARVRQLDPGPGMRWYCAQQIRIGQCADSRLLAQMAAPTMPSASAWKLAFSPDSALLLTGTHSGKLNLWSIDEGAVRTSFATKGRFVMSVAYVRRSLYGSSIPAENPDS